MDCACFCHLLKIQHCCMCPNGRYNPPSPVHPIYLPHPSLLPTALYVHANCNITVAANCNITVTPNCNITVAATGEKVAQIQ